jgi:hypothetical protein
MTWKLLYSAHAGVEPGVWEGPRLTPAAHEDRKGLMTTCVGVGVGRPGLEIRDRTGVPDWPERTWKF